MNTATAAAGAGAGFLVGGPVGAVIGGVVGAMVPKRTAVVALPPHQANVPGSAQAAADLVNSVIAQGQTTALQAASSFVPNIVRSGGPIALPPPPRGTQLADFENFIPASTGGKLLLAAALGAGYFAWKKHKKGRR